MAKTTSSIYYVQNRASASAALEFIRDWCFIMSDPILCHHFTLLPSQSAITINPQN
jgi:hypothetical protein